MCGLLARFTAFFHAARLRHEQRLVEVVIILDFRKLNARSECVTSRRWEGRSSAPLPPSFNFDPVSTRYGVSLGAHRVVSPWSVVNSLFHMCYFKFQCFDLHPHGSRDFRQPIGVKSCCHVEHFGCGSAGWWSWVGV